MKLELFTHWAADPFYNMAFDEAMLEDAIAHPGAFLVRLYTWRPGAITIGLNQVAGRAVDLEQVGTTPIVRRATGGRALYHDESELTYSFALNLQGTEWEGMTGSVAAVYRELAEFLRKFLEGLGRKAVVERGVVRSEPRPDTVDTPPCFASSARYELKAGGKKVVASAQRQIGSAVLQHGAVKLFGIADHPALPGAGSDGERLPALTRNQFDAFVLEFGARLAERWPQRELIHSDPARLPQLETHLDTVRKSPLTRRDCFEQSSTPKGL